MREFRSSLDRNFPVTTGGAAGGASPLGPGRWRDVRLGRAGGRRADDALGDQRGELVVAVAQRPQDLSVVLAQRGSRLVVPGPDDRADPHGPSGVVVPAGERVVDAVEEAAGAQLRVAVLPTAGEDGR